MKGKKSNWRPALFLVEGDEYPYWGGIIWKNSGHFDLCFRGKAARPASEEAESYAIIANRNGQPKCRTSKTALPESAKEIKLDLRTQEEKEREIAALNKLLKRCRQAIKRK